MQNDGIKNRVCVANAGPASKVGAKKCRTEVSRSWWASAVGDISERLRRR